MTDNDRRYGGMLVGPDGSRDYIGADELDRPSDAGESQSEQAVQRTGPNSDAPTSDMPSIISTPHDGQ